MSFKKAVEDWESRDDWPFADREAERKHFYEAGERTLAAEVRRLRRGARVARSWLEDSNTPDHGKIARAAQVLRQMEAPHG